MGIQQIKILQIIFLLNLVDLKKCQTFYLMSPNQQITTADFDISDEQFEGQPDDKSLYFRLWSRFAPLESILQVGNIGILDSDCLHYINVADRQTKRVNFIYYDCFDYERRIIKKRVEFIDDKNEIHQFQMDIKSDEYEAVWFFFYTTFWPKIQKFKIIIRDNQNYLLYEDISLKYPFQDKNLTITTGGGLEAYFNNIMRKYSYYPGTFKSTYLSTCCDSIDSPNTNYSNIQRRNLDSECVNNQITYLIDSQIFSKSDTLVFDFLQPNQKDFKLMGWIKIIQAINPKSDQNYKIIKIGTNSQNNRLTIDDLSAFQLFYKISNTGNSIIFTTYSYTFPTVNLDALNERFLITYEFEITNNIYTWHFLQATLQENQLTINIQFYDDTLTQVYEKSFFVRQFSFVNFHLQFGNILMSSDSYLNLQMARFQFTNCITTILYQCFNQDCSDCSGPSNGDCLSCFIDTKKVYFPLAQQCICPIYSIDLDNCFDLSDLQFSVIQQEKEKDDITVFDSMCYVGHGIIYLIQSMNKLYQFYNILTYYSLIALMKDHLQQIFLKIIKRINLYLTIIKNKVQSYYIDSITFYQNYIYHSYQHRRYHEFYSLISQDNLIQPFQHNY